ncbi:MAG: extracellular solute-binding protein [Phycisphaerae bacterium]|nr:extracellular solute-binding protein [Phycisphaerae bacterium]
MRLEAHPRRAHDRSWARRLSSVALAALALLVVAANGGCGRRDALVVYVSADETVARPVLQAFTAKTGIPVAPVFDTEATKTTGLAQRLRAEANRPRADVFWSSEIVQTIALADEGLVEPSIRETPNGPEPAALAAWRPEFRDAQGRWFAFAARARVIVYATDRVKGDDIPSRWTDLAKPRFKGRVVMADPRFGTTRTHMGVFATTLDRLMVAGAFDAYLLGLRENEVRLLTSGNAGVVDAVAAGEADVGMTDTDDVFAAIDRGLPVAMVMPRHAIDARPGGGTLLIPNTVGVVTGTTRGDEARQFVEFLLSSDGEAMLAASPSRNIPLGSAGSTRLDGPDGLQKPDWLLVDWTKATKATDDAVARAMRALTGSNAPAESRTP